MKTKRKLFLFFILLLTSQFANSQCNHIVRVSDTYGDGWNGGTITIQVNGVNVFTNVALAGSTGPEDFTFSATPGQNITVIRTADGSYPYEMRIEILNAFCNTLLASTEPTGGAGNTVVAACTSSIPEYTLTGSSSSVAPYECVTLTPNATSQRGCAWDANSTLNFASDFTYDFIVNLGSDDGGADGLAFTIQNDPRGRCACGAEGGGLGSGGIQQSLIIEIDTYLNGEDRDDGLPTVVCVGGPDPDHLDLWVNGNVNPDNDFDICTMDPSERVIPTAQVLLTSGGSNYNVENGLNHTLRVNWNVGTSTLTAQLKDAVPGAHSYATVSYTFNPTTLFGTTNPLFGFTASTGGLTNTQSFCLPPVLLPIELLNFNAYCADNSVIVDWSTISELNNDKFIVEKSSDLITIEEIGEVNGAGNSYGMLKYSLKDDRVMNGIFYYRLKQVDFDGTVKYFPWQAVECHANHEQALVFPNPSTDHAYLQLPAYLNEFETSIFITDISGKLIQEFHLPIGYEQLVDLDLNTWSKGSYLISIVTSETNETLHLLKN